MAIKIKQRETGSVWSSDSDTPLVYNNLKPEYLNPNKTNTTSSTTSATEDTSESTPVKRKAKNILEYFQSDGTNKAKFYNNLSEKASESEDGTYGGLSASDWKKKADEASEDLHTNIWDITGRFGEKLVDELNESKHLPQTIMSGLKSFASQMEEKYGDSVSDSYKSFASLAKNSSDGTYGGKTESEWLAQESDYRNTEANKLKQEAIDYADKAQDVGVWVNSLKEQSDASAANLQQNYSETEQFFGDLAGSAGQMVPSMVAGGIAGKVVGGAALSSNLAQGLEVTTAAAKAAKAAQTAQSVVSLGTMYANVFNNTYNTLYQTGQYDITDISAKANLDALIEVGTEVLVGGTPGMGRGILDTAEEKVLSKLSANLVTKLEGKIANTVGASQLVAKATKFLVSDGAKWLYDVMGEGVEEVVAEALAPYVDRATIDPDAEDKTASDYLEAFAGGAITAAFFNTASVALNRLSSQDQVLASNGTGGLEVKNVNLLTTSDYDLTDEDVKLLNGPVSPTSSTTTDTTTNTTRNANIEIDPTDSTAPYKLSVRNAVKLVNKSITDGLTQSERTRLAELGVDADSIRGQLYRGFMPSKILKYSTDMTMQDVTDYINDVLIPQYEAFAEGVILRQTVYNDSASYAASWKMPFINIVNENGANRSYTKKEYVTQFLQANNIGPDVDTQTLNRAVQDAEQQFDTIKAKQIEDADKMVSQFGESLARFGIGIRVATEAEVAADERLQGDNAYYDANNNVIVCNPYAMTNEFLARMAVAHEFVHAAEFYSRDGAYGQDNFKFSDSEHARGKGMTILENQLDAALEAFGIDAKAWRKRYRDMYERVVDTTQADMRESLNDETKYAEFREFVLRTEEDAAILSNLLATSDTMFTTATNCQELTKGLFDFVSNLTENTPATETVAKEEYTKIKDRIKTAIDEAEVVETPPLGDDYDTTTNEELIGFDETPDEDYIATVFQAKPKTTETKTTTKTKKTTKAKKSKATEEAEVITPSEEYEAEDLIGFDEAPDEDYIATVFAAKPKTTETKKTTVETPIEEKPTVAKTAKKAAEKVKAKQTEAKITDVTDNTRQGIEAAIGQAKKAESEAIKDWNPAHKIKAANLKALKQYKVGKGTTKMTKVFSTLTKDSNGITQDEIWILPNGRTTDKTRQWLKDVGFTVYRYGGNTVWRIGFDQHLWDVLSTGEERGMTPEELTLANDSNDPVYNKAPEEDALPGAEETAIDAIIANSAENVKGAYDAPASRAKNYILNGGIENNRGLSDYNPEGFIDKEVKTSQLSDEERERLFGSSTTTTTTKKAKPTKAVLDEFKKTASSRLSMLMQYPELDDANVSDDRIAQIYEEVYQPKVDTFDNMYSKVEIAIDKMSENAWNASKGDSNFLVKYLRKSTNGVSAEEIKYSGIVPYIQANPTATKEDAIKYLQMNPYMLQEVKRPDSATKYDNYATVNARNYQEYLYNAVGTLDDEGEVKIFEDMPERRLYHSSHWRGDDANNNIVVHTRESDYNYKGDKVKFIEEIQSDLHNAANRKDIQGNKRGYYSPPKEDSAAVRKLKTEYSEVLRQCNELRDGAPVNAAWTLDFLDKLIPLETKANKLAAEIDHSEYNKLLVKESELIESMLTDSVRRKMIEKVQVSGIHDNAWDALYAILSSSALSRKYVDGEYMDGTESFTDAERQEMATIRDEKSEIENRMENLAMAERESGEEFWPLPDEPYKTTYTDYAVKRIIDRAVRQGYDRVAWTSSDMQVDRWDDAYRKGYEIEYDQDIPNFLKKYLAQWGIKLEKIDLDTGAATQNGSDGPDFVNQLRRSFEVNGPGLYDDNGNCLGKDLDNINTDFIFGDEGEDVIATLRNNRHVSPVTGLTFYQYADTIIAQLNNAQDMVAFARTFPDWTEGDGKEYTVQSFKINDAMREDIMKHGQSRFSMMADIPDFNMSAEDEAQWRDLIDRYGSVKKTSYKTDSATGKTTKTTVDTDIPKYTSPGQKVSQTAYTVRQGLNKQLDDATRKNILADGMSYTPVKIKKYEADARSWLNSKKFKESNGEINVFKALGTWNDMVDANNGALTANDIMKGMVIWAELKAKGEANYNFSDDQLRAWDELMTRIAVVGHNVGLSLNLFRQMSKLDGTGRDYYMQVNLDSLRSELHQYNNLFNKKVKGVLDDYDYPECMRKLLKSNLSDAVVKSMDYKDAKTGKDFSALKDQLLNAKQENRAELVVEAMKDDMASAIPPTVSSRVRAWRYLSMLGNPRTHVRNIISNAAMYAARNLRDVQSGAVEDLFGPKEGTHNTSLKNRPNQEIRKLAKDQWAKHKDEIMAGGKLSFNADVLQRAKSFGNSVVGKGMEATSRWNSDLLESEDSWFLNLTFKQAFASYVAANQDSWLKSDRQSRSITDYFNSGNAEATENLNKALSYATREAQRATYREANELASWLNAQEKKGTVRELIIEGIAPFKRTPINILKQGGRYSPVGLAKAVWELTVDAHNGKITKDGLDVNGMQTKSVADALGDLCAGMTGSEILLLGLFLGGTGALRTSGDDDKDKTEYYTQMLGNQQYSVTIGDMNFTLDWLTPISMPLFAGVALAEAFADRDDSDDDDLEFFATFNDIAGALWNMTDPFMNLSLLSGVNDALNSYSENKLGEAVSSALGNYASQFVPTMGGQIARTIDPTRRTTYAPKDADFPGGQTGAKFWNKIKSKIPGLASTNAEYIDQWGRTSTQTGDTFVGRALNQMVVPWYAKEVNKTEVDDLIAEVFAASEDKAVIPSTPQSYYSINGKTYHLDADEYTTTKKTVGQLSYAGIQDLSNSPLFSQLTSDQQAEVISEVYEYARAVAKEDFADMNDIELTSTNSDIAKVQEAQAMGISLGEYYIIKKMLSNGVAGTKTADKKAVARTLGLDHYAKKLFGL